MTAELSMYLTASQTQQDRFRLAETYGGMRVWDEARPWLVAGLFASCVVLVWGVFFPWLSRPSGSAPSRFAIPFTMLEPLSAPARAAIQGSAVTYWTLGFFLSRRSLLGAAMTRAYIARVLVTGSVGVLGFVLPLLAVVWTLAALIGAIPEGPWGVSDGNHGPWRHIPDLRLLLHETLLLPGYSLLLGRVSILVHPSRPGWYLIVGSVLAFFILFGSHYWLID